MLVQSRAVTTKSDRKDGSIKNRKLVCEYFVITCPFTETGTAY